MSSGGSFAARSGTRAELGVDFEHPFLHELVPAVADVFSGVYFRCRRSLEAPSGGAHRNDAPR